MPITSSAKKAMRQDAVKKSRNQRRKVAYRSAIHDLKKAIEAKAFDKAKALLTKTFKTLDKAAQRHTIQKNKADRLKSRLSVRLNKAISPK